MRAAAVLLALLALLAAGCSSSRRGKGVFDEACSRCHAVNGNGRNRTPAADLERRNPSYAEALRAVRDGHAGVSFRGLLTEQQMGDVAGYASRETVR